MKPSAIVYTSNTGYTAAYAALLQEKTQLPVYTLDQAAKKLADGSDIIYLGWLMASRVQGYKKAARRYHVRAVCGVGMGATGSQLSEVRKTNALATDVPVFTVQGGFNIQKLRGIYKVMMRLMVRMTGKTLAEKKDRTPEEDTMLEMMTRGGSRVSEENLAALVAWYAEQ